MDLQPSLVVLLGSVQLILQHGYQEFRKYDDKPQSVVLQAAL